MIGSVALSVACVPELVTKQCDLFLASRNMKGSDVYQNFEAVVKSVGDARGEVGGENFTASRFLVLCHITSDYLAVCI